LVRPLEELSGKVNVLSKDRLALPAHPPPTPVTAASEPFQYRDEPMAAKWE
jgi:hypothetical protein